jgi:hypothetical protein
MLLHIVAISFELHSFTLEQPSHSFVASELMRTESWPAFSLSLDEYEMKISDIGF